MDRPRHSHTESGDKKPSKYATKRRYNYPGIGAPSPDSYFSETHKPQEVQNPPGINIHCKVVWEHKQGFGRVVEVSGYKRYERAPSPYYVAHSIDENNPRSLRVEGYFDTIDEAIICIINL